MPKDDLTGLPEGFEYAFKDKIEEVIESKTPLTFEESLDPATGKRTSFKIMGEAIDDVHVTRNGVQYQNLLNTYKSLEGKPFLDSHDDSSYKMALGHVESVQIVPIEGGHAIRHVTDIDPMEEDYIRKVKRGDCNYVSISAVPEKAIKKKDRLIAPIAEFLHLAAVSVPGHRNSKISGYLAENFNTNTGSKMPDDEKEKPVEDAPKEEPKAEVESLLKIKELEESVKSVSEKLDTVIEMLKDDEKEDEPPEEPEKKEKVKGKSVVIDGGSSEVAESLEEKITKTFYKDK